MNLAGKICVMLSVECAYCGDVEDIPVPLGFNMPSLSHSIENHDLMKTMSEADMAKTDNGWMHKSCAAAYHTAKAKESAA